VQSASIVDLPLVSNDAVYVEAGERLGSALAAAGVRLIYGGGTTGVMGAVAHGTLSAGGEIGAIIPKFLINRETTRAALTKFNDVTITETMHERKHNNGQSQAGSTLDERGQSALSAQESLHSENDRQQSQLWDRAQSHQKAHPYRYRQIRLADITYIRLEEAFIYPAIVLEAGHRRARQRRLRPQPHVLLRRPAES
jgi:hypothetical protein